MSITANRNKALLNSILQEDLSKKLQQNEVLASKYRSLQNEYMAMKNTLLNKYDDKVKGENSIKDLKQVVTAFAWYFSVCALSN